ncbi:MAG: hypothetical protein ABW120_11280 [Sedimenticola sp.]
MKLKIATAITAALFASSSYAASDQELSDFFHYANDGEHYAPFVTSNHDVHPLNQLEDGPSIVSMVNDQTYFSPDPAGTVPAIQQGTGEHSDADILVELNILPR